MISGYTTLPPGLSGILVTIWNDQVRDVLALVYCWWRNRMSAHIDARSSVKGFQDRASGPDAMGRSSLLLRRPSCQAVCS
jgi:hypothetical protein